MYDLCVLAVQNGGVDVNAGVCVCMICVCLLYRMVVLM